MAFWKQTGVSIQGKLGEKTITYSAGGVDAKIESRRRAVEHADGRGFWMHTTYWVLSPDGSEKEYWKRCDAESAAEEGVKT